MLLRATPALLAVLATAAVAGCTPALGSSSATRPVAPATLAGAAPATAPSARAAAVAAAVVPFAAAPTARETLSHSAVTATPRVVRARAAGKPLAGLTVVLDPGHNGANAAHPAWLDTPVPAGGFTKPCNTAGAETDAGYPEHAFTWDVAVRAERLLRAEGATVVLTRHSDTGFGPCVNVRAQIGNASHAAAVVAIHADGAPAGDDGFHVIAPALAPDHGNAAILARSYALAVALRAQFHAVSGEPFSTYIGGALDRRSDLAGLNLSRVPAVFIECGNMRNAGDAARETSPAWRQRAAAGIVAGVRAFLHR